MQTRESSLLDILGTMLCFFFPMPKENLPNAVKRPISTVTTDFVKTQLTKALQFRTQGKVHLVPASYTLLEDIIFILNEEVKYRVNAETDLKRAQDEQTAREFDFFCKKVGVGSIIQLTQMNNENLPRQLRRWNPSSKSPFLQRTFRVVSISHAEEPGMITLDAGQQWVAPGRITYMSKWTEPKLMEFKKPIKVHFKDISCVVLPGQDNTEAFRRCVEIQNAPDFQPQAGEL